MAETIKKEINDTSGVLYLQPYIIFFSGYVITQDSRLHEVFFFLYFIFYFKLPLFISYITNPVCTIKAK